MGDTLHSVALEFVAMVLSLGPVAKAPLVCECLLRATFLSDGGGGGVTGTGFASIWFDIVGSKSVPFSSF